MFIIFLVLPVLLSAKSPLYAIDIGNQNISSNQMARLSNEYSLVFLGAMDPDGFITSLCNNVRMAIGHMPVDIYMTPKYSENCSTQIVTLQTELAKCADLNFKSIWLRIAPESGWSTTPYNNIACLEEIIAAATDFEAIGMHSSREQWETYLPADFAHNSLNKVQAIWYTTSYDTQANMHDWGKGFGNFTTANVKQFEYELTLSANPNYLSNRDIWIPSNSPKKVDDNNVPIVGGNIMTVTTTPKN